MKKWIILLSWLWFHQAISAQTTLQVASKSLKKDFENIKSIQIASEKADIEVQVWSKPTVGLSLELKAGHPERSKAAEELEFLKYEIMEKKGTLILRTFLSINKKDDKPSSNYKVKWILKIPHLMDLGVNNTFGKINLEGQLKSVKLTTEFCKINMTNVFGKNELKCNYGEITMNGNLGNTTIATNRTDLNLLETIGRVSFSGSYGTVTITKPQISLTAKTEKATYVITGLKPGLLNLHIENKHTKILCPAHYGQIMNYEYTSKLISTHIGKPTFEIFNSFGVIKID